MQISQLRLSHQKIVGEPIAQVEEVVRWHGAMQAQLYHSALWAIGLRTLQKKMIDVEQAITERKIVRTWPMRGTIHFIPATDIKWMLSLTASRELSKFARRFTRLELDEQTLARCEQILMKILNQTCVSRPNILEALESEGIQTKQQRGYTILSYFSHIGLICQGPVDGNQPTFTLLDQWIPHAIEKSREEALITLVERYFQSHGPATIKDFVWWSGLTVKDTRNAIDQLGSTLISEKFSGIEYWGTSTDQEIAEKSLARVQLLPAFDEYLLGYKERSAVITKENAAKVVPGNNGMFLPTLVIDGQISGIWKPIKRKQSIEIQIIPFVPINSYWTEIEYAANEYCQFIQSNLSSIEIQY
ncbi:Winged helix DNA-binding domain-containing protein [Seinonella peptonophila]|uniref:Winged helix DNA-binding domain-containing protein n=1 Tax=Seinonella peptonophila TaxID=112248 RepID=A0A1M4Z577_9BACL|nr:winged helix DNA-binding domain-containing protein [Seinonella peptonophila]SHF13160.1 Winged helix DNA-binding domain-containing protein [Seinonella peptonophila]